MNNLRKALRLFSTSEMAAQVDPKRALMREICKESGGPGTKEGWAALWQQGLTLWDLKGPTPVLYDELTQAVCEGRLFLGRRSLVPGCGTGYDVKGLANAGMDVVGCDIAEEALAAAKKEVGVTAELLCCDFFTAAALRPASFHFIFDYTFFCALPPSLRNSWGRRTSELLEPGGRLLTLAFPLASDEVASDPNAAGPPHPVSLSAYKAALEPHGLRIESGPREHPKSLRSNEAVIWWVKD